MEHLVASALFITLYAFLGIGPALWICPRFLRADAWALAPWVGYAWVVLVGWYGYRLELPGVRSYLWVIVVPPAVAGGAWLVRSRVWRRRTFRVRREVAVPLVVAALVVIVMSVPFLALEKGPTVLSMGNNDAADTDSLAGYLESFARSEPRGFLGQSSHYLRWLADSFVFGGPMSLAVAAATLPYETWQLQCPSIHAFFGCGVVVLFVLARRAYRFSVPGAAAATALYGLSSIMFFVAYQTYQAQVIAIGLTLAIAMVMWTAWESAATWRDWIGCALLLALFSWGLAVTYPHMVILALAPLLMGGAALAGYERRWIRLVALFGLVAAGLAGMLALFPPRGPDLVRMLLARSREAAGWFVPWLSPDAVAGLTLRNTELNSHQPVLRMVLSLAVLALLVWGWLRTARREPRTLVLAAAVLATVVAGYVVLCMTGGDGQGWGGYKSFKLLSFFLPFVLLAMLLVFRDLEWRPKGTGDAVVLVALGLMLAANLSSAYHMTRRLATSRLEVTADMADLERLAADLRIESVNILGDDWWRILWEARFLMTKTLFFETSTYSGRRASALEGDWDLVRRSPATEALFVDRDLDRDDLIPVNSSYLLRRHDASPLPQ